MADEEQLKILKQGVEFWNFWREENRETRRDLCFNTIPIIWLLLREFNSLAAILFLSKSVDIDLQYVDLEGVIFTGADFRNANLRKTKFRNANLQGADFSNANLQGADFRNANLQGADFSNANILSASFKDAILIEANFEGAVAGTEQYFSKIILFISFFSAGLGGLGYKYLIFDIFDLNKNNAIIFLCLTFIVLFYIVSLYRGLLQGFAIIAIVTSVGISLGTILSFPIKDILAITGLIGAVIAFAFVGIISAAYSFLITNEAIKTTITALIFALTGVLIRSFMDDKIHSETISEVIAILIVVFLVGLNGYIGWSTIKNTSKNTWLRKVAIILSCIESTNFYNANLANVKFMFANLKNTDLRGISLDGICLKHSKNLDSANLGKTLLAQLEVRELLVNGCSNKKQFVGLNLRGANLTKFDLNGANLEQADISNAILEGAKLKSANLTNVQAIATNFDGANLTGACIQDLKINDQTIFDNIICDYIFLNYDYEKKKFINRKPKDLNQNFASGEFTEIARKIANAMDLFSKDSIVKTIEFPPEYREAGISILTYFDHVLRVKYPNIEVKVRIEQDEKIVRMVIESLDGKTEIIEETLIEYGMVVTRRMLSEDFLKDRFEIMALNHKLEMVYIELKLTKQFFNLTQSNFQEKIEILKERIESLESILLAGIQNKDRNIIVNIDNASKIEAKAMIENKLDANSPKYDLREAKFGGGFAGRDYTGDVVHSYANDGNLSEAAREIQELLEQLSKINPTATNRERMAVVTEAVDRIESNPTLRAKVINALKTGGTEAFKEAIDHPLVNILMAAMDGWKNVE